MGRGRTEAVLTGGREGESGIGERGKGKVGKKEKTSRQHFDYLGTGETGRKEEFGFLLFPKLVFATVRGFFSQ